MSRTLTLLLERIFFIFYNELVAMLKTRELAALCYYSMCVRMLLYVCLRTPLSVCLGTPISLSSSLYLPKTRELAGFLLLYVSAYYYIRVPILLYTYPHIC